MISDHRGAQRVRTLPLSHCPMWNVPEFSFHLTQQSLLSYFYLCVLLEKKSCTLSLNCIPATVKPGAVHVQIKPSDDSQFYLGCQTGSPKGLWFFCCLVAPSPRAQKSTTMKVSPSWPSRALNYDIVHSTQLNSSRGSSLHLSDPLPPGLGSGHTATDSISGWLPPRSRIINSVDAWSQKPAPA